MHIDLFIARTRFRRKGDASSADSPAHRPRRVPSRICDSLYVVLKLILWGKQLTMVYRRHDHYLTCGEDEAKDGGNALVASWDVCTSRSMIPPSSWGGNSPQIERCVLRQAPRPLALAFTSGSSASGRERAYRSGRGGVGRGVWYTEDVEGRGTMSCMQEKGSRRWRCRCEDVSGSMRSMGEDTLG